MQINLVNGEDPWESLFANPLISFGLPSDPIFTKCNEINVLVRPSRFVS